MKGAKEAIVNDSINKAKSIYGDPLPDIVQARLDKELHSITTYGFSVMYRIAQELVRKSLSDGLFGWFERFGRFVVCCVFIGYNRGKFFAGTLYLPELQI